ncbi:MAG: hypothetical protein GX879_03215, partial [Bacteroidales bacterium]|nr:hypothetical protein [Bacteroidales bacterium]
YISAHPLDEYAFELKYLKHVPLEILKKADISLLGSEFLIAGYITSSQTKITKKGKEFGQITLEDYTDSYTLNLFGNDFRDFKNYLQSEQCVLISIKFQPRYNNPEEFEAKVQKIEWLNILKEGYFRNIELAVDINNIDQEFVKDLEKIVKTNKGKVSLFLRLEDFEKQLSVKTISRSFSVDLNEDMIEYLETNNYFTDIKLY